MPASASSNAKGQVAAATGEIDQAQALMKQALLTYQELGDPTAAEVRAALDHLAPVSAAHQTAISE
jgi:hypothetical protein